MESILRECGSLRLWKRNKNEKAKPVAFGTVEFYDVKGIIRTMKILNNKVFKGKRLDIKMGSKPKKLIGKFINIFLIILEEYVDFLRKEIEVKEGQKSESEINEIIMKKLTKGDKESSEKIQILYDKFDGTHSKIEKLKQKEIKEMEEKYNKYLDPKKAAEFELTEKFNEELKKWVEHENVNLFNFFY